MTCFFIGHRFAPETLKPILLKVVERHITYYGVTHFIVGQYGAFDHMAAGAVIEAKTRHPEVSLSLLLPYHPSKRPTEVPTGFDSTYYPEGMETVPDRVAIKKANELMIQSCDYLICYNRNIIGNTRDLVAIAELRAKKGLLHITNLAECLNI